MQLQDLLLDYKGRLQAYQTDTYIISHNWRTLYITNYMFQKFFAVIEEKGFKNSSLLYSARVSVYIISSNSE